jgi:hypothetical protein
MRKALNRKKFHFIFSFFFSFIHCIFHFVTMNGLDAPVNSSCLLAPEIQPFEPQAEDILTDEDLLDLFRIVKQVLRKNPDSEKLAKLLFCMSYALGDHIKFSKPCHEDRIVFRDNHSAVHSVRLPSSSSCCANSTSLYPQGHRASTSTYSHHHNDLQRPEKDSVQKWIDSSSVTSTTSASPISPLTRLPSVSHLTNGNANMTANTTSLSEISNDNTSSDPYSSVRPFSNFRPLYTSSSPAAAHHQSPTIASPIAKGNSPSIPSPMHHPSSIGDANDDHSGNTTTTTTTIAIGNHTSGSTDHHRYSSIQQPGSSNAEVVMEPQQRGFYYQDGRIAREPVLLQRYAEQGILTQASLMRKRKRHSADANSPYEISNLPVPTKKPKIPHRHGEFEQRRRFSLDNLFGIVY